MIHAEPFTVKDNGRTVTLAMDSPFEVELAGNPTTGYAWELLPIEGEAVKPVGTPEFKQGASRLGAGGKFLFKFQAVGAGEVTLRFVYRRPWEKEATPVDTFEITIVVGTMGRILEE